MTPQFLFPSYKELHPYNKRVLKRIRNFYRYHLYSLWCYAERKQFESYLNHNPLWIPVFTDMPYRCNAVLKKFCDNRFNKKQRVEAVINSLAMAESKFGRELASKLVEQKTVLLAQLTEELSLYLNLNKIDPFEGFFSLNIRNKADQNVYDASFTFLQPNLLLIASIQGPKMEDAKEVVKGVTKALFGARPMFLLVHAFQILAQTLDCELVGIAHKYQGKYRWNDHSRLLFNYDEFWQENHAEKNSRGYWKLPLTSERKPLEDIASKKRSMYRKRYEMFDKLEENVIHVLKHHA
ncbi:VirK/YbjX family protein [Otariodibacter sp.]|uniref:VirK/YbjX family protein n=1 Tax=Otariodibacter sp. TaxID=3030919 RepID=UPI00260579F3|nr:VirK/YbjX family protein [Otariodibacter sp.]